jgi:hypothetical protein
MAIAGAKPGYDGVEMLAEMDQRILTEAARRGFHHANTLCLHRATIRTAELLGFVALIRHSYDSLAAQGIVAFDVPVSIHKEAIFFTKELAPQTT